MAIQNPPITENSTLDFVLFEMVRQINELEQKNLKLLADIKSASDFADLQTKVQE
jgi:hypothetical protein